MFSQKGFVPILVIILTTIVLAAGGYYLYQTKFFNPYDPFTSACTQDAKLCPDGSSVGRVGPKCEFAPCPTPEATSSAETANWKTYTNKDYLFEFRYPVDWNLQVVDKLPKLINSSNSLSISLEVFDPAVVGVSYCEANYQDIPRCESFSSDATQVTIDWGIERSSELTALITSSSSKFGLSMILETNKEIPAGIEITAEDKKFFRIFLSTFKFLDQNASGQSDGDCQPRPACLDAITTPRCLMPEPAEGWCP